MTDDVTRRDVLQHAGAAIGMTGLAGCGSFNPFRSGDAPRSVSALAEQWGFENVVRLADAGGDPSGQRSVNAALDEAAVDGALVYLEPGTYRLTEQFTFPAFDRFGLVGNDAIIVPEEGYDRTLFELGTPTEAGELIVDGITFDFRAEGTGGRPVVGRVADRLVFREITVRGEQDIENDTIRIDVASPDGEGLIERLQLPDGGSPGMWDGDSGVTGCEVGSDNRGDLAFVDCRIEGFPDNGLYADPPEGRVRVEGGYYANNGIANVRVNADAGSVVRGVHVRCDEVRDGVDNMRGIRLRGGGPITVEDCLVEMEAVTSSDGGITVHSELEAATIKNSRIVTDANEIVGIRVKSPSSGIDTGGQIGIEGVLLEGTAERGGTIDITDRQNCTIDRVCIHQPGLNRDGIRMHSSRGQVVGSNIAVGGRALVFDDSEVETTDLSIRNRPPAMANQFCSMVNRDADS